MKALTPIKNTVLAFSVVVCLLPQILKAQSTNQNYIKKTAPVAPVSSETTLNALNSIYKIESINYIDGLGRGIQDVLLKASPNNYDIVQPTVYDQYGRSTKSYLPYIDPTNDGSFKSNALTNQATFYNSASMVAKTTFPYSESVFDNSPLNNVIEKSAPDTDWKLGNGHTTKVINSTNNDYEVFNWQILTNGDVQPVEDFYYNGNLLNSTKLTDPNGNYSYIYTDKAGKTICTKQFLEMRGAPQVPYYLTTYMVYDDFGQLVMVIPPKAMDVMDAAANYSINALTQDLVFKYKYDERHRLIEKKVPGTGWSYIVYNQLNQPVLFQDANLQMQNKWSFIKYDILGRPIISGLFNASGLANFQTRTLAQAQFNANQTAIGESEILLDANNPYGYTNVTLPNQNLDILTVNYYDDYDFDNNGTADYSFNSTAVPCINFNITYLQNLNSSIQTAVSDGTSIDENLNQAIKLTEGNESLTEKLNICINTNTDLSNVMAYDLELSNSLLQVENENVLGNLNASLEEDATSLSAQLLQTISQCIELDPHENEELTTYLADILNKAQKTSEIITSGLSTIRTINSGCQPYSNIVTNRTRGYLTGSRVKVIDAANPTQWEISTVFYDDNGQAIQSQSNDHMGGTDLINMVYDFVGNVTNTQQIHTSPGQSNITVLNHMSYDKMGRLTRVDQKNNSDFPVILTKYNYNELSQLIDKKVHSINNGTSFLQSMDYRYNIQGWLTSINNVDLSSDMSSNPTNGTNDDVDDLWGMQLNYNANTSGINGVKQYTGNVAEKKWCSVTDNIKRAYGYDYDKIDRLKSSSYVEYNSSASLWNSNIGKFDEKDITYDANGNIMTLKRYGFQVAGSSFGLIDNLSYQYNGNFLGSINDATTTHGQMDFKDNGSTGSNEYTYDGNGNLTSNPNKGITNIAYNHLNLPTQITFSTGSKIEYTYDAAGTRLRKKVTQGATVTTKNYAGLFEYNTSNQLELMHNTEGRCVLTGVAVPQFRYEYQYTDNTGNVTMAFSDMDNNGTVATNEVIQQSHYYSFGMRMEGTNVSQIGVEHKYKFSGKEFDDELGLNEYDFGARFYDPAIARWGCIDPMADAAPNWTPFRYGFNNPITVTDPTGMFEYHDPNAPTQDADVTAAQDAMNDLSEGNGDEPKKWVWKTETIDGKIVVHQVLDSGSSGGGSSSTSGGSSSSGSSSGSGGGSSSNSGSGGSSALSAYAESTGPQISDEAKEKLFNSLPNNEENDGGGSTTVGTISTANGALGLIQGHFENVVFENKLGGALSSNPNKQIALYQKMLYQPSGFAGTQVAKTSVAVAKVIKAVGWAGAGMGLATDVVGLINYSKNKNPNTHHVVTPAKAATNTVMTGIGIWGGPPGWIISSVYFINDAIGTPHGNTLPKLQGNPFRTARDNTFVKLRFP